MQSIDSMEYHPLSEKLVDILCTKTENTDRHFFRIQTAFFFCKVASMMRTNIHTLERGNIPVNMYAINLAPSGYGKGMSTNILEDEVIQGFRKVFLNETLPKVSQKNLAKLAVEKSAVTGNDPDTVELPRLDSEYRALGELPFSFDSATTAAVKQMRLKLLLANAGSMNLIIDEIGSNLLSNAEVLGTYLELFDVGKVKQKLVKNTPENRRLADIDGTTPANCLLFGTPSRVFDGAKTEDEMRTMLFTGYARRSLFGYANTAKKELNLTPEEIYDKLTDQGDKQFMSQMYVHFHSLADINMFGHNLKMPKSVSLINIQYKKHCEHLAAQLPEHEEIRKAEIAHRYSKVIKLAGAYAFIDKSIEITEDHLHNAIKLVEDSGEALERMLQRERPYMKIARYLADANKEMTHVDLMEDLPCYKGSQLVRRDLMDQAVAWGYTHNIIISRSTRDTIEFIKGDTLQEVDQTKMNFSFSTRLTEDYSNDCAEMANIHVLTQQKGLHWVNHHLMYGNEGKGYRNKDNVLTGCDMIVLDIDENFTIPQIRCLLEEYTYHIHTTKSHTEEHHRCRVILPLSHRVKLNDEDYTRFIRNIVEWLPFDQDDQTCQRERKWMTHQGEYWDNKGKSIDSFMFIPKTKKEENLKKQLADLSKLDSLERWFVQNTQKGSRSNKLLRYALMLVDAGADINFIHTGVNELNQKTEDPLEEAEINNTIMVTVAKKISERDK